jgi:hypothetical protein
VLRWIFGPKRQEVTDGDNCVMKIFIIVLFTRYFKDAQIKNFVACIGETSNAWKILDTKSKRKIPLQTFKVHMEVYQHIKFHVHVLQPPQKFERSPFWKDWACGINRYGLEVTFNFMASLLDFIRTYSSSSSIPILARVACYDNLFKSYQEWTQAEWHAEGDVISFSLVFN